MPFYDYHCADNGATVEVFHSFKDKVETWGQVCRLAEIPLGDTPPESLVKKLISAPGLAFPKTNTELKNMGFTKLVKREKGIYENVTATSDESRYMKAGDDSTTPKFQKKISD